MHDIIVTQLINSERVLMDKRPQNHDIDGLGHYGIWDGVESGLTLAERLRSFIARVRIDRAHRPAQASAPCAPAKCVPQR